MPRIAQIASTARYLPERAITNAELRARFIEPEAIDFVDKFAADTGISQRFHAPDDWATSDLALPAAKEALIRAGRKPTDVDLIIVGTDTPDHITLDTSVVLQHRRSVHLRSCWSSVWLWGGCSEAFWVTREGSHDDSDLVRGALRRGVAIGSALSARVREHWAG